jgi:L-arabinose isomerase
MIRPRVGLLVPFVPFYEKIVPLRDEKVEFARALEALLSEYSEVISNGLVCTEEEAREAASDFTKAGVDGVVVAPSLAVFGALAWAALEHSANPVCIWNAQPAPGIPSGYNVAELIRNSGGLGVQALANTLARAGREFEVVFSSGLECIPDKLLRWLRAAGVAAALRRARFGVIGSVFPQMTDVAMDRDNWPGAPIAVVGASELTREFRDQSEAAVAAREAEIRRFPVAEIGDDEIARSVRLSLALDAVVERFQLAGGAFNCHGENCLQNPEIGITACYAVSAQTSQGRPFSCTGDLPTAIALWILRQLAGCVIYGELDLVDPDKNLVLLANGGEGDFSAAVGPVSIAGNENFRGLHGRGASLRFDPFEGPATLLSFTPLARAGAYRMVMAEGELVRVELSRLGVFHAAFRFEQLCAETAFERWCEAGAVHHLAIAPGRWQGELKRVARISGFEAVAIGGGSEIQR